MNYWTKKQQLAERARNWMIRMEQKHSDEIDKAVKASVIYDNSNVKPATKDGTFHGTLTKKDTVSALFNLPNGFQHICVLNFASYKNPGGKFLEGSSAQEESLCHESFLFNVLKELPDYYEWNKHHLNHGLYTNRAIYTPNVLFQHGLYSWHADVLTCAAPNRSCIRYGRFTEKENDAALKSRIDFIANIIAEHKELDAVILGAFGCGVFKQDAARVAKLFQASSIPANVTVEYAIPDNKNYNKFEKVLSD